MDDKPVGFDDVVEVFFQLGKLVEDTWIEKEVCREMFMVAHPSEVDSAFQSAQDALTDPAMRHAAHNHFQSFWNRLEEGKQMAQKLLGEDTPPKIPRSNKPN